MTRRDFIAYAADLLAELAKIALRLGLKDLAMLIDVARLQAVEDAARHGVVR